MQVLIIMQGIPGSGKSTLAKRIQQSLGAVVRSTDDLFVGPDGIYRWDSSKIAEYHATNLKMACEDMNLGYSVIVDNTNILRWQPKPYIHFAVSRGIPVVFIRCEGDYPNVHAVPPALVAQMKLSMQELSVEKCLAAKAPWEV